MPIGIKKESRPPTAPLRIPGIPVLDRCASESHRLRCCPTLESIRGKLRRAPAEHAASPVLHIRIEAPKNIFARWFIWLVITSWFTSPPSR